MNTVSSLPGCGRKFGEEGYSETTVESIAEEAGASKGTLYQHLPRNLQSTPWG
ncbi:MAG: helix-turn-helix domain-containing protein [Candidatus Acetothermia bacterium]